MGIFGAILPSLIGGAAKLVGGLFSKNAAEKAADKQADLQRQFAQNAIQWKVEDAKKAGIHPLYAMGANTVSYQPVSVGDTSLGSAFSDMGQDLSRAVEVAQSAPDRVFTKTMQALQLERAGLENGLLKSQIARNTLSAQVPPPGGVLPEVIKPPERTPNVRIGGKDVQLDPTTSNLGQLGEERYGEGPAQWITGGAALVNDIMFNLKNKSLLEILREVDRATSISKYGYK